MKPFYPADLANYALKPFKYTAYIASIAATATGTVSVTIRENTAFAILRIVPRAHVANTYGTVAYCDFMITDNGAGRNLFDRKLPADVLAGHYVYPQEEMTPYIVAGNSTLNFEVTSKEAANALTFWCILYGCHLYNQGGGEVRNV